MKWEIKKTQFKISDFVSWKKAKTLTLSPSFQRRPVWKTGAKSFLIDTIVRGLPVPIIFLRDKETNLKTLEPIREVVDGQQRLRTVLSYISHKLIDDYQQERDNFVVSKVHNKALADKQFSDLPNELKQAILNYEFSVHVLPPNVGDRDILKVFARLNATGVKLNGQELRNAEYFGKFKTSVYDAAFQQLERWREWKVFTEDNIARMLEVELTSEFYMLMLKGVGGKSQVAIDDCYKEFNDKFVERKEIEVRFTSVMDTIEKKFREDIAQSIFSKKTLFYALFAAVYEYTYGLKSPLTHKTPSAFTNAHTAAIKSAGKKIEKATAPQAVVQAASRRTTHISSRKEIVGYLVGKAV